MARAKFYFGRVEEEVVTRAEFPLEKARHVPKDEVVAVLGYGIQGPAQALNMRDNGIRVIVGQKAGSSSWDKAVADGRVPGTRLTVSTLVPCVADRKSLLSWQHSDR